MKRFSGGAARYVVLLGGLVFLSIALFMPVAAQAVECTNAGAGGAGSSGNDGGTASNVTCGVG